MREDDLLVVVVGVGVLTGSWSSTQPLVSLKTEVTQVIQDWRQVRSWGTALLVLHSQHAGNIFSTSFILLLLWQI